MFTCWHGTQENKLNSYKEQKKRPFPSVLEEIVLYPKLNISEKEPLCDLMSLLIPFHSNQLESEEQLIANKMLLNETIIQYSKS